MTIEGPSKSASTENRLAARQWVDAFNARDEEGEADARTADYIGHALDSMHSRPLQTRPRRRCSPAFKRGHEVGLPPASLGYRAAGADSGLIARELAHPGIDAEWSILWAARAPTAAVGRFLESARRCADENNWLRFEEETTEAGGGPADGQGRPLTDLVQP